MSLVGDTSRTPIDDIHIVRFGYREADTAAYLGHMKRGLILIGCRGGF